MNRTTLLAACVFAVVVPLSSVAQDLAATAGKQAKVVLDNDKVRVIQLDIAPGGKTGMHSHRDHVVIYLKGGDAMQTMPDGTRASRHADDGQVIWSDPVTHETVNAGKTPVKVLVVELKDSGT
jgi:quercetin dioxygenase-like cupin family protein